VQAPVVTRGAVTLAPPAIASTGALYAPAVRSPLFPPALSSTASAWAPTLLPGPVVLAVITITATGTLGAPTVVRTVVSRLPLPAWAEPGAITGSSTGTSTLAWTEPATVT
jgi:hypothetical protein